MESGEEPTQQCVRLRKRTLLKVVAIFIAFLVLGIAVSLSVHYIAKPGQRSASKAISSPLASYVGKTGYSLYYPSSLPSGFSYKTGSIHFENGILFFVLVSGDSQISISEQIAPDPAPEIGNTAGNAAVKKITTPEGQAIVGTFKGSPSGVMLTKNTLINATSPKTVTVDQLVAILEKMTKL